MRLLCCVYVFCRYHTNKPPDESNQCQPLFRLLVSCSVKLICKDSLEDFTVLLYVGLIFVVFSC